MKKIKPNIVSYKDKKAKLFLIFLALSFFFWFLSKLSKDYTTSINLNVHYINQPKDKKIFINDNQKLTLTIKSSGFGLLKNTFKKNVDIDLSQANITNKKAIVNLKEQIAQLQEQLGEQIQIIHIQPEKLAFDFGKLNSKKVKVIPNLSLSYKSGYYLTKPVKITPDSIKISGPKEIIDTIQHIYTQELNLKELQDNFSEDLKISKQQNKNIKYNTDKVHITGIVEKNTEGEINLPFQVINTNGANIKTFENKVKAKYKVSLKNYDKVKASDFQVICDYAKTKKDSLDYLIPEVRKKSNLVTEVELTPKKIEYLILK
jgi:hypothetical protein